MAKGKAPKSQKAKKSESGKLSLLSMVVTAVILAISVSVGKDYASSELKRMNADTLQLISDGNELETMGKLVGAIAKYEEAAKPTGWPWNLAVISSLGDQINDAADRTVSLHLRMAKLYERMDQYEPAIESVRKARAVKPHDVETLRLMAILLSASEKEYEVAEVRSFILPTASKYETNGTATSSQALDVAKEYYEVTNHSDVGQAIITAVKKKSKQKTDSLVWLPAVVLGRGGFRASHVECACFITKLRLYCLIVEVQEQLNMALLATQHKHVKQGMGTAGVEVSTVRK